MSEVKTVDIKGLLDTYEFPYTLPGSGKELLIKPITTGQMKKILVYENETDPYIVEEALDRLITDCVVNEDFDIDSLYLQDRFSLLLEIRKVTKGDTYQFNWKCPKCGIENIKNIVISELPVMQMNRDNNILEINERLKFEVDFPTRRDQKDAITRMKSLNTSIREKQIDIQTGTFANCIRKAHTPEGVLEDIPFEDKMYILENVPTKTFEEFVMWFKEHDFGVDFEAKMRCISGDFDDKIEIPLSDFFV